MSEFVTTPSAKEGFLNNVKSGTAALHQKLERSGLSSRLMSPDVTEEDYLKYLSAMRNIIEWYERVIFPMTGNAIPNMEVRRKYSSIDNDLKGSSAVKKSISGFIQPRSLAEALGYLYVIEGSTLGGMVILKQLQDRSFISSSNTNFFNVYGRNTGIYWREFIDQLSTYAVENKVEEEVIEGAKNAFRMIDEYFASVEK